MSDSQLKSLLLFFYLIYWNEQKAIEAAIIASKWVGESDENKNNLDYRADQKNDQLFLIQAARFAEKKMNQKYKNMSAHLFILEEGSDHFKFQGLDASLWKSFLRMASGEEVFSLIWCEVFKVNSELVAYALGLNSGTIRYRVGKALKKIGNLNQYAPKKMQVIRT